MKVFISWSGDRSKALAEELRDWLPTIVQSLDPFISTQDVPVGERGLNVLASQLQDCSFGILCLTQENNQGPWIHFEAGALSKVIDKSRVVPLLLDLKVSDLTGPLAQFQAIPIGDQDQVFSLIKGLAASSSPPIAEGRLKRLFDAFWPELYVKISELQAAPIDQSTHDIRSQKDILEEILLLSRNIERLVSIETDIEAIPAPQKAARQHNYASLQADVARIEKALVEKLRDSY